MAYWPMMSKSFRSTSWTGSLKVRTTRRPSGKISAAVRYGRTASTLWPPCECTAGWLRSSNSRLVSPAMSVRAPFRSSSPAATAIPSVASSPSATV